MRFKRLFITATVVCVLPGSGFCQDLFIAGTSPERRPENAPVISKEIDKNGNWYGKALTGVAQPYPYSLHFLENQGGWFNPFIHPGAPGPYDIRGWHKGK